MFNQLLEIILIMLCIFINTLALAKENELQKMLEQNGYVKVPLHTATEQNSLYTNISLNDKKNYAFVIDTGATSTTVDSRIVKKLGLKLTETNIRLGGADNKRNKTQETIIPSFNFGNFVIHDESAFQSDPSFMGIDKNPIRGLLGLNFLRQHKAILLTAERSLYLQADTNKNLSEKLFNNLGYKKISLIRSPSGHQIVLTQVDNSGPVQFMLDSGVPKNIIALTYAKKLALPLTKDKDISHGAGGGEVNVFTTQAKKFSIGQTTWLPHDVMVLDLTNVQIGSPIYGIIGLNWLQAHQAIIDTANDQLYVKSG